MLGFRSDIQTCFLSCTLNGIMQIQYDQTSTNMKKFCLEYYGFDRRILGWQQVCFFLLASLELRACSGVNYLLKSISVAPEGIRLEALKIVGIAEIRRPIPLDTTTSNTTVTRYFSRLLRDWKSSSSTIMGLINNS